MSLETDGPDLTLRLAALMHDIGKPATKAVGPDGRVSFHHHELVGARMTKQRLRALRFPKDVITDVVELVALHLRFYGYGRGEWTDSAVRRYVTDAGDLLPRLHKLTRSDCTTRNRRKAAALAADYDALEERIARIAAEEDLARVRPDLDGNAIMELLGLPPSRRGRGVAVPQGAAARSGPAGPRRGGRRAATRGRPSAASRHRRRKKAPRFVGQAVSVSATRPAETRPAATQPAVRALTQARRAAGSVRPPAPVGRPRSRRRSLSALIWWAWVSRSASGGGRRRDPRCSARRPC